MLCPCGSLSVREATAGSIVGRRRLIVHLAVRTGRRAKALRSAVRFRSVLRTRDQITLDLDGLLRLNEVVIRLL